MSRKNLTIINPDGSTKICAPKDGETWTLEEVQDLIDGIVDVLYLNDTTVVLFDEEGATKGLPKNLDASHYAGITLLGTVAIGPRDILYKSS